MNCELWDALPGREGTQLCQIITKPLLLFGVRRIEVADVNFIAHAHDQNLIREFMLAQRRFELLGRRAAHVDFEIAARRNLGRKLFTGAPRVVTEKRRYDFAQENQLVIQIRASAPTCAHDSVYRNLLWPCTVRWPLSQLIKQFTVPFLQRANWWAPPAQHRCVLQVRRNFKHDTDREFV